MHGTLSDQSLIYLQIAQMLEDDILRGVYGRRSRCPPPMSSPGSITSTRPRRPKGSTSSRRRGSCISAGASACSWPRGRSRAVRAKRKAAFYDSYVRPLVKEGASLAVTGEELLAMVRRAIEEGEAK